MQIIPDADFKLNWNKFKKKRKTLIGTCLGWVGIEQPENSQDHSDEYSDYISFFLFHLLEFMKN